MPEQQRRISTWQVRKPAAFFTFADGTVNYACSMDKIPSVKPVTRRLNPTVRRCGPKAAPWGFRLQTLLTALLLAPMPLLAAPAATSSMARAVGCLIEPDRVADVGSQVVGVVERLYVERGDTVKAGQNLVSLRNDIERANVSVADTRARVDAEVLAAKASLDLALQKVRRAESLVAQNFVSTQAVEQARGEAEVARQKLSQVDSQRKIWVQERRVAQAQLAIRSVRSPFAGVVAERYINVGERVEERPMLRIAVINPLRVELLVPTALYGRLAKGDQIAILPELPGAEPVQAKVQHVDQVLDAASNSFRVRLSLPNPDNRLPAGLRCKAEVPGADTLPAAPAPGAPAGPVTRPKAVAVPAA
jgi:membrane fusion protein, heavy metal efflux system